jgi:hypothetical protein
MWKSIILVGMVSGSVYATDWAACVEYWYYSNVSTNVPSLIDIVTMRGTSNFNVDFDWKVTPHPNRASLLLIEPQALAWKSNQVAEAAADIDAMEIKNVIRALVKTINLRLPADKKITEAELKAAIKESLK